MDKIMKNKRALELVTSRLSGYKQGQKNSFISDVLSFILLNPESV